MPLDTVLEAVESQEAARNAARQTQYRKLVETLARKPDAAPAADEISELLAEVGKSAAELKADVELVGQRDAWRRKVREAPAVQAERDALMHEIDSLGKGLLETVERMKRELREKIGPKQQRISQLQTQLNEADTARNRLQETSPVKQEIIRLSSERGNLLREVEGDLARQKRQAVAGVNAARTDVDEKSMRWNAGMRDGIDLPRAKKALATAEEELARVESLVKTRTDKAAFLKQRIDELEAEAQNG